MYRKNYRTLFVFLILMFFISAMLPVTAKEKITHGTATELITLDMLNNTPPMDYVVNEAIQGEAKDGVYAKYFLKDEIQTVYIEIDENNLNYLFQNAIDEPSVMATSVTIGDVTLGYCGLKTKGSYSLEASVENNPGSDRFSFTVNFGKYIKKKDYGSKQNFFGCQKISFNNFTFDKSMMKEYMALKLLSEMGVPVPEYGLAKLYINGNYYGVYAMIETFDKSILERYFNADSEELSSYVCKPKDTTLLYDEILKDASPLWEGDENTRKDMEDMIPTAVEWVRRLNCLSEGTDFEGKNIDVNSDAYLQLLEQILNVDEALRYFAVNSWLCQTDNMFTSKQNYGIYLSREGVCTIVPWDYDLSFGCYYPLTAEETANYPVDVMYMYFEGKRDLSDNSQIYAEVPLFNVIYQNAELMERYHAYMKDCSRIAVLGGTVGANPKSYEPGYFNSCIEDKRDMLVEAASEKLADNVYYMNKVKQPAALQEALPNLSRIIALRAVSVFMQLEEIETTVCAEGCNLGTLGRGKLGTNTNSGILTIVDSATGIYAKARYEGTEATPSPMLTVKCLNTADEKYREIERSIGDMGDLLIIYEMSNTVKPATEYTLTIPLASEYTDRVEEIRFYSYIDGKPEEIKMQRKDNLFTGNTENIEYIVITKKDATTADVNVDLEDSEGHRMFVGIVLAVVIVAALSIASIIVIKRRKVL